MNFKTPYELAQDAKLRDQPYLDTIISQLVVLIDNANIIDLDYKVVYDLLSVTVGLPVLQQRRIAQTIVDKLTNFGYRVNKLNSTNEFEITITWRVAKQLTSL